MQDSQLEIRFLESVLQISGGLIPVGGLEIGVSPTAVVELQDTLSQPGHIFTRESIVNLMSSQKYEIIALILSTAVELQDTLTKISEYLMLTTAVELQDTLIKISDYLMLTTAVELQDIPTKISQEHEPLGWQKQIGGSVNWIKQ